VCLPVKKSAEIRLLKVIMRLRGNTLKSMEKMSGARISIQGPGSVKEGKERPDNMPADDAEIGLRFLVSADTMEKEQHCFKLKQSGLLDGHNPISVAAPSASHC
jgi:splicing factor 1